MIEFTGYITLAVRADRPHTMESLHALAKRVLHKFPACQSYNIKVFANHTDIAFIVPGDADTEDEAATTIRSYGRIIHNAYQHEFSTYTSSGSYEYIEIPSHAPA